MASSGITRPCSGCFNGAPDWYPGKGQSDDNDRPIRIVGFQWSPRLVSGEGSVRSSSVLYLVCFNGAPDWYPGKGGIFPYISEYRFVSMEPQIGIRGREEGYDPAFGARPLSFNGAPDWYPGKAVYCDESYMHAAKFQWSPRLVSGEGSNHPISCCLSKKVSMEPQIGIRGRDRKKRWLIENGDMFQWSPR